MGKAKYKALVPGGGYGWAGMTSALLSKQLEAASKRFVAFRAKQQVDAVAFSGSSGAAIGFYLAVKHKLPCVYVRKSGEDSHGSPVECNSTDAIHRYLIVDDFISSGATVKRVIRKIEKQADIAGAPNPVCVGVLCFDLNEQSRPVEYKGVTYSVI